MFTGIIKSTGEVKNVLRNADGFLFSVDCSKLPKKLNIDDSLAIDGCCQTVVKIEGSCLFFQAVKSTLEKTTLKNLKQGMIVNLEPALVMGGGIDGHIVSGHINCIGKLIRIQRVQDSYIMEFSVPEIFSKYIISEGSISINGVSLTISEAKENGKFQVNVIPHSYTKTNLSLLSVDDQVNIEFDIIAKYLEKLIGSKKANSSLTLEKLFQEGF